MRKKRKTAGRRKRLPNDMLVMLIISELFAVSFCCLEIQSVSIEHTVSIRTSTIYESLTTAEGLTDAYHLGRGPEEGIEAYEEEHRWKGPVLTKNRGTIIGPSGKETYYNLNMSGIVRTMRNMGYTGEYWVRDDGCKMLGEYIMVAANLDLRPRGSIVETSLGEGLVCDTGGFAKRNPTQIDIATNW